MKKSTIFFSLLSVLVTLSLLLTGACKGSGTTTGGTTPTGEQVITLNLGGEVNTIDPNRASWSNERSVMMQVFDGLLAFDSGLNLVPMVAKAIPTVANKGISADGLTYTITLKSNATWSDGTKVTAGDFAFSIKRLFDPKLAAEYASFYFDIVGGEAYYGSADKTAAEQTALKDAIGVRAINDTTLEIKLIDPLPTFTQLLALWPVYPVRQDMITAHGDAWAQPDASGAMPYYIGNGPFVLQQWVQQDHFTFVPNTKYWGDKPTLTKITFKELTDANVALAAYKNNELDQSGVPGGTEKATMADSALSPEIVRYAQLTTYGLQFNVTKPPFDNKALRQAFSCAVDRLAYIDLVRGGVGKPTTSWIPPGMPGYDATLGQAYTFNPTQAKAYLAEAGYANGVGLPVIKFQYANTGSNPTLAAFLQEQIKTNLGVDLTLEAMESKSFSALVNAKEFSWAFYGWGADYPDPDNWLPQIFGTGAGNNKTGYSNPNFDALAASGLKELDNTKRLKIWADAQALVIADAPMVFLFNRETFVLKKPWVKGQITTGMDGQIAGDMFLRDVYIQK
ncbi:MAG: peptide ABC transporter substrate-binding protein [Dehalococcoidales bacterium]|nr:peptide ABC transporter substrate-binding protein [Dehalococcoidales bacterium]